MASPIEAVAIVIDVGPSVQHVSASDASALDKSIAAANLIIQRKIFSDGHLKKRDEVAIILFGTDGTSNSLHEGSGGYEHITLAHELAVPDLNMLKFVNRNIRGGSVPADFVDALVVAMDHLRTKTLGRKMDLKIILFSDLGSPFGADLLDEITHGMKDLGISFIFVGPEMPDKGCDEDLDFSGTAERTTRAKPLTERQLRGVRCVKRILDEVDGEGMSLNEVLPMLSFFAKRKKGQVTVSRTPIEIGSSLKINAYCYVKTKEEKLASWKKLSALAEVAAARDTMAVEVQRSYHLNDEDQTEVPESDTAFAYRYGKTLVPMTADDKLSQKWVGERCLQVLGFTADSSIDRSCYCGDGCYIWIPQPGDQPAAVAFSALCHALDEKRMVAIARFCARANAEPKIGFLKPHIKSSYESLLFVALPFSEDLRQYSFASLAAQKKQPTEEQLNAVDELIDEVNLVRNEGSEELFKPSDLLNPVIQYQCQCVQSRALDPEQMSLPKIEEYIERSLRADPEMVNSAQATLDKIKRLFPLVEVSKKRKATASELFGANANLDGPDSKKGKPIEGAGEPFAFANLSRNLIREVGTADPASDFEKLIEDADVSKFKQVCEQLLKRVTQFVHDSFLDQYYPKAIQCLKSLRRYCIQFQEPSVFNDYVKELRDQTQGKRRGDFWKLFCEDKSLRLISQEDCSCSSVSAEDAEQFLSGESKGQVLVAPTNDEKENADDLFDLM